MLSAYLDKIVGDEDERRVRLPPLGFDPNVDISFSQFLGLIAQFPARKMDMHWQPQANILGGGRVIYDFIGRFESFARDWRQLSDYLDLQLPPSLLSQPTPHTRNASEQLMRYYDSHCSSVGQVDLLG